MSFYNAGGDAGTAGGGSGAFGGNGSSSSSSMGMNPYADALYGVSGAGVGTTASLSYGSYSIGGGGYGGMAVDPYQQHQQAYGQDADADDVPAAAATAAAGATGRDSPGPGAAGADADTVAKSPRKPKGKAPFADNPTLGLVPLSATDLYLRRMTGWAKIVHKIVRYFETVADQEKRLAESFTRCAKELAIDPAADGLVDIFSDQETVQTLVRDMANAQTRMYKDRTAAAELIEFQLLPILRELHIEIRKKTADVDKEWGVLDKEMKHDLETYVKMSTHVRNALMRQQWKDDPASLPDMPKDVPKDPYLADLALKRHISHCIKKQEYYRSRLTQQQDSFAAFEKVIVQNIRVALSMFYDSRTSNHSRQLEQVREMKGKLDTMEADKDWAMFIQANCDRIMEQADAAAPTAPASHASRTSTSALGSASASGGAIPLIALSDLTYDGHDDPAIKSVREGQLFKKEGVFKRSFRPIHVVLTASGYLHIMPPLASTDEFPEAPEQSLDLTECTLAGLLSNEKDPEEIAITEKAGGMFGRELKHKFKGKNMAESAEWWRTISDHMSRVGKRNAAAASSPGGTAPGASGVSAASSARESTVDDAVGTAAAGIAGAGLAVAGGVHDARRPSDASNASAADASAHRLQSRLGAVSVGGASASGLASKSASSAGLPPSSGARLSTASPSAAQTPAPPPRKTATSPHPESTAPQLQPHNAARPAGLSKAGKGNLMDGSLEDLPQSAMPPSPSSATPTGSLANFATFSQASFASFPSAAGASVASAASAASASAAGAAMAGITAASAAATRVADTASASAAALASAAQMVAEQEEKAAREAVSLSQRMEMALQSAVKDRSALREHLGMDLSSAATSMSTSMSTTTTTAAGSSATGSNSNAWATFQDEDPVW